MEELLEQWKAATAALTWYEQRAFLKVFKQAQNEEIELVWGSDYAGSGACLVNSASSLTRGDWELPMKNFPKVVSLFDQINAELRQANVNVDHRVSPLAAETFVRHFAPLRKVPKNLRGEPDKVVDILSQIEAGLPVGAECEPINVDPANFEVPS